MCLLSVSTTLRVRNLTERGDQDPTHSSVNFSATPGGSFQSHSHIPTKALQRQPNKIWRPEKHRVSVNPERGARPRVPTTVPTTNGTQCFNNLSWSGMTSKGARQYLKTTLTCRSSKVKHLLDTHNRGCSAKMTTRTTLTLTRTTLTLTRNLWTTKPVACIHFLNVALCTVRA